MKLAGTMDMSQPSAQSFLDLAAWTYNSGMKSGVPDQTFKPFEVNGNHYASNNNFDAYDPSAGFYGAAYSQGSGSNERVVVGFEGTNTHVFSTQPEFATNEIRADLGLYYGQLPSALTEAATFTQSVIATAEAAGISKDHIFLTGHSLGAAEAEYADVSTGLKGVTYGAPGISTDYVPAGSVSGLTDYVERGDPVGNYAYTAPTPVEGAFIYSDKIQHFGDVSYLGHRIDALPLKAAGVAYGSQDPVVKAGALATLLAAANVFHPLTVYAKSLGLSDNNVPSGARSIGTSEVASLVESLLHGSEPLLDTTGHFSRNLHFGLSGTSGDVTTAIHKGHHSVFSALNSV